MPLPAGFPMVDAAAFIMIYATSHHALIDQMHIRLPQRLVEVI